MSNIRQMILNNKHLTVLSKKTQIPVDYLAIAIIIVVIALFDCLPYGSGFNNLLCLIIPLQESIISLKSVVPNPVDMKKSLLILTAFSVLSVCEGILRRIIPMFSYVKVFLMIGIALRQDLQSMIQENIIGNIPNKWLCCSNSVESAIEKTTKMAEKIGSKANEQKNKIVSNMKKED